MKKRILLIFIIISIFLFTSILYSKSLQDIPVIIEAPKKTSPPVLKALPIIFEKSYCSGYICLPPGNTPSSLGLNQLSLQKENYDYTQTTLDNKTGTSPRTGNYSIPVLLVKFPNFQAPSNYTQDIYNDVFNASNYLDGNGISVSEFYKHNSYDQLDVTYDVYDWRMLPLNYNNYVVDPHQLVVDSINAFGTGPDAIDFTQYDSDNDGRLDGVIIVHAGFSAQEQPGHIKSMALIYKNTTAYLIQGKNYGNAAIVPSRHVAAGLCNNWQSTFGYPSDCRLSVDTSVHEFAHVIGLPDLYEISYNGIQLGPGLGGHTVMALRTDTIQDSKRPVNFDMWSKFYFGWITPTVIDSAEQANIYTLNAYDTNHEVYLLRNPETMGEREFFLVTNRYISESSLDKHLFGIVPPTFNIYGGIDILHVDEEYIDQTYAGPIAFNSVMHDPDGDYYDDNVSHPGIVFEQNILDPVTSPPRGYSDLYTTELPANGGICDQYIFEGKFDNIERHSVPESCPIYRDTTSSSYLTLDDSKIRVYGWSDSGYTMQAYLTVDEPLDLTAEIVNPENIVYGIEDMIDFIGNYEFNIGQVDCSWFYNTIDRGDPILLSDECSFSGTPSSLGLEEDEYIITFVVEDEFLRVASDTKQITIVPSTTLYNLIINPVENTSYPYKEIIDFTSDYFNQTGDVSCVWKHNDNVLSEECNFSATPFSLGLLSQTTNVLNIIDIQKNINPMFKIKTENKKMISQIFKPIINVNKENKSQDLSQDLIIIKDIKNNDNIPLKTTQNRGGGFPPNYIGSFSPYIYRTITLITTDDITSYSSQVTIKICLCDTIHPGNQMYYT